MRIFLLIIYMILYGIVIYSVLLQIEENKFRELSNYVCQDCNLILIVIDALRYDHLPCYGYNRDTAPFICSVGSDAGGVIFEDAVAVKPLTLPSFTSILSGEYPYSHGIFNNHQVIDNNTILLSEVLNKEGYSTNMILNVGLIANRNLDKGSNYARVLQDKEKKKSADLITQEGISIIEKQKDSPFFLLLHYYQVHAPYAASENYTNRYYKDNIDSMDELCNDCLQLFGYDERIGRREKEYIISQYDANINLVDDKIREIFLSLEMNNLTKKTIVIITADHGETLGDYQVHGDYVFGHNFNLKKEQIFVPLIIHFPNINKNYRIRDIKSSVDIFPSIMKFLNINIDHSVDGNFLFEKNKEVYAMLLPPPAKGEISPPSFGLIVPLNEDFTEKLIIYKTEDLNNMGLDKSVFWCLDKECKLSFIDTMTVKKKSLNQTIAKVTQEIGSTLGCPQEMKNMKRYIDEDICFFYPLSGMLNKMIPETYFRRLTKRDI